MSGQQPETRAACSFLCFGFGDVKMAVSKGIVADTLEVNREISPEKTIEEIAAEITESSEDRALRTKTLKDYIGQEDAKS